MKIEHESIKIGDRVRLGINIELLTCTYTKGHEFTVIGESRRGWDLMDDNGNEIQEVFYVHGKLELIK